MGKKEMKNTFLFFFISVAMVSGNVAEAQFSKTVNPAVGTWHASEDALAKGLPSRITVERFSGALVGNKRCKWKSEMRTTNNLTYYFTRHAAIIDCTNMEPIVVKASTSADYFQDEVLVSFGDSSFGNSRQYRYASAKALEERRRARENPVQKWGQ